MTKHDALAIAQTIKGYINNELFEDGTIVEVDDDLLLDIGMDSISLLMLISFIENEYEIEIPPGQITIINFRTVTVMSNFLVEKINKKSEC